MAPWFGVDVGAERKGFDVALVDERALRELRGGLIAAQSAQAAYLRSALQRSSIPAKRHTRSATPHVATNRPTMT